MYRPEQEEKIYAELTLAEKSRSQGLEGRARVSARRAAGLAVREFLYIHRQKVTSVSAYDLLKQLRDIPDLPPVFYTIADHLTTQVSEDFSFPIQVDLIAETRLLIDFFKHYPSIYSNGAST
jgi:hypothetical protein